ncbi:MAG: hypothetical protein IJ733_04415 [Lachnospiraceae bacterium]|nr:hypothetical protein [Lachnospiraceae bacterium]
MRREVMRGCLERSAGCRVMVSVGLLLRRMCGINEVDKIGRQFIGTILSLNKTRAVKK